MKSLWIIFNTPYTALKFIAENDPNQNLLNTLVPKPQVTTEMKLTLDNTEVSRVMFNEETKNSI